MRRKDGFSLMEMMAVILLIGLLTGAVAWSLNDTHRRAKLNDFIDRLRHMDQTARLYARRFAKPVTLRYDLNEQAVVKIIDPDNSTMRQTYRWPDHFELTMVILRNGETSTGEHVIAYTANGHSPTYVLQWEGSEQQRLWILVTGPTGQWIVIDEELEITDIVQLLQPTGDDAG